MFIPNNKIYINKNINKKYLSNDNKFVSNNENEINVQNNSNKTILLINDPLGYFVFLSFMSIWLGNLTRRKLYNFFKIRE